MWARVEAGGIWHYSPNQNLDGLLCSTAIEPAGLSDTRSERPNDLDSPICYRCWFNLDWAHAIEQVADEDQKAWLSSGTFEALDREDADRLSSILRRDHADRLRVLSSLADTYDHESACPENSQSETAVTGERDLEIPPRQPKYGRPPRRKPIDARHRMDYALIYGTVFLAALIPILVVFLLSWK